MASAPQAALSTSAATTVVRGLWRPNNGSPCSLTLYSLAITAFLMCSFIFGNASNGQLTQLIQDHRSLPQMNQLTAPSSVGPPVPVGTQGFVDASPALCPLKTHPSVLLTAWFCPQTRNVYACVVFVIQNYDQFIPHHYQSSLGGKGV